ncbi:protein FAM124A [Lampetra fluviatilis]
MRLSRCLGADSATGLRAHGRREAETEARGAAPGPRGAATGAGGAGTGAGGLGERRRSGAWGRAPGSPGSGLPMGVEFDERGDSGLDTSSSDCSRTSSLESGEGPLQQQQEDEGRSGCGVPAWGWDPYRVCLHLLAAPRDVPRLQAAVNAAAELLCPGLRPFCVSPRAHPAVPPPRAPPASPRPRLLVELTAVEAADVEALMELFSRPPWRPVAQLDLRHRCQQQQQHLRHQQQQHLLHRRSLFSDQQELDNYDFKQQTQSYRFHQQQHNLHQQHDQHLAAVDDDGDQQQLAGLSRRCRCPYRCRFFSLGDLDSPAWVIRVPCRCAAAKQDPSLHRHPHHHQQHHHQQDHHHHLEQPTAVLLYVLPCGPSELGPLARFYGLLLDGGSAALPNPGCCWSRELSAGPGLRVQLLLRADEAVPAGPPTPAPCAHLEMRVPALAALPCQRRARLLRLSGVRWQAEDPSGRTLLLLLQNAFVTPPLQTRRSLPRGVSRDDITSTTGTPSPAQSSASSPSPSPTPRRLDGDRAGGPRRRCHGDRGAHDEGLPIRIGSAVAMPGGANLGAKLGATTLLRFRPAEVHDGRGGAAERGPAGRPHGRHVPASNPRHPCHPFHPHHPSHPSHPSHPHHLSHPSHPHHPRHPRVASRAELLSTATTTAEPLNESGAGEQEFFI